MQPLDLAVIAASILATIGIGLWAVRQVDGLVGRAISAGWGGGLMVAGSGIFAKPLRVVIGWIESKVTR